MDNKKCFWVSMVSTLFIIIMILGFSICEKNMVKVMFEGDKRLEHCGYIDYHDKTLEINFMNKKITLKI